MCSFEWLTPLRCYLLFSICAIKYGNTIRKITSSEDNFNELITTARTKIEFGEMQREFNISDDEAVAMDQKLVWVKEKWETPTLMKVKLHSNNCDLDPRNRDLTTSTPRHLSSLASISRQSG